MDAKTVSKCIVGVVLLVAIIGTMSLLFEDRQAPLTGQVYSVKTKPVTCGDDTCQNWENEDNCVEDCGRTDATVL